jgi:hypothetical protein
VPSLLDSIENSKGKIKDVEILFLLSLPGLVVILIFAGIFNLARAKKTGKRRPGAASFGLDQLDTALRPGSEHKLIEQEKKRSQLKKTGNERDF